MADRTRTVFSLLSEAFIFRLTMFEKNSGTLGLISSAGEILRVAE